MEELNALVNEGAVSNIDYNQPVANSGLRADLRASTAAALVAEVGRFGDRNVLVRQLVANSGLLADLQASTAAALAAEVGSGVSASDITVSVQQSDSGEVKVHSVILRSALVKGLSQHLLRGSCDE